MKTPKLIPCLCMSLLLAACESSESGGDDTGMASGETGGSAEAGDAGDSGEDDGSFRFSSTSGSSTRTRAAATSSYDLRDAAVGAASPAARRAARILLISRDLAAY